MYQVLQAETPINAKPLNQLAVDGWRLVTILTWASEFYFYFIRVTE